MVRKSIVPVIGLLAMGLVFCCGCKKEPKKTTKELAREAAVEACECVEDYSIKKCQENINRDYTISDEFIDEFNRINNCGLELERIVTSKNLTLKSAE